MANEPFDINANLIALLGVQDLPEEERVGIIEQATELIQKRVIISLLEGLSDEEGAEAAKLADDPEKLLEMLIEKSGMDLMVLLQKETEKLKNELVIGSQEEEVIAEITEETEI